MFAQEHITQPRGPCTSSKAGETPALVSPLGPKNIEEDLGPRSEYVQDEGMVSVPSNRYQPVSPSEPKKIYQDYGARREIQDHRRTNRHWMLSFVVLPGLAVCWIPGILAWKRFPDARVWGVKLLFWSIWLSILWAGWWFASIFLWIAHKILLVFVRRLNAFKLKRYVNWLEYLRGYLALVAWTLALWVTWVPIISERQLNDGSTESASSKSIRAVNLGGRLLFALTCSTGILLVEKTMVQWIAMKFHERSYQRRIEAQQKAMQAFRALYAVVRRSTLGVSATPDLERETGLHNKLRRISKENSGGWPSGIYLTPVSQKFNFHYREVEKVPTSSLRTAFTDASGQIFGTSTLTEDDVVGRAFHSSSSRKIRSVAGEIWRELAGDALSAVIYKSEIEQRLKNPNAKIPKGAEQVTVDQVWEVLTNGRPHVTAINEDDFTTRCSDLHDEQRRLEETMRNLQNVVGQLDNLLLLFWVAGSILLFVVALEAELKEIIIGSGSVFLGLSWLLHDTASEVTGSIVLLFSKHPFDVEDKVIIEGRSYTVKEMRLLSTVFCDGNSVQVQAPNNLLNTCFIHNLRRSPATSEPFTTEVSDRTTEEQLENFRARMIRFLKDNPNDYRDEFIVVIKELSLSAQKMVLSTALVLNDNWTTGSRSRVERRNTWICHLRASLKGANIEGPGMPSVKISGGGSSSVHT